MYHRHRTTVTAAAGIAAVTLLAGCGGGNSSNAGGSSSSSAGGSSAAAAAPASGSGSVSGPSLAAGAGKGKKLGMTLSTLNNPFFVSVRNGAQQEASKLGANLTVTDGQNDASQQANQVQNFLTQQVDAIIVNPVDSKAIVPSVKAANNAKTPVLAVDRGSDGGDLVTTVASDNVAGGRQAADEIAKLVGSGSIVVLQGTVGTSAERDRSKGFTDEMKKYPNITVAATQPADFDRTKALDVMTNLLQAHPDIKGVFAENDEMALGAIKALGSKAGSQVKVVGFDGTPEGLAAVKAGTENADVAQQPTLLGSLAVQYAVAKLSGQSVPNPVQVPVEVVTQDNVSQFTS